MRLRSLLFVPGDRPDRMEKALGCGADALILDLEDSVTLDAKPAARRAAADFLRLTKGRIPLLVRINPLDSGLLDDDLAAILEVPPDGLVLPKAEGASTVEALSAKAPGIPVLPIATETPAAIFQLGSYTSVSDRLVGLTWGAEDLPAAIGALGARDETGRYTAPYELARSLTLFGAHAAGVAAIETVYPALADADGLAAYARRARFDGFNGMMAIHPAQVPVINQAFTPSAKELAEAQAIVDAFAANPNSGALRFAGRMIDAPHLKQAKLLLEYTDDSH
ncbi:HpcH/HpaI aldolase/citrate lyase family protein [Agrobacterium sp. RAC06]|uniref:HpcH/HpaI aldolase/citrate lyase family protein n=1 Tax=Agrobacterium sp. RAC06 TaxID=1842536 RepID=UPI00083E5DDD|nr:CoA ester lyase [Agrobacterium sp. RAC06]AOG10503.1 hpcH/HpaI aldolase/citrate lyase family protein [Agrobacterium sp. RAC06]